MKKIIKKIESAYGFVISVKFAVFTIVSLGIISAVGTVYESLYDMEMAQELVYHSPYMYVVLGFLCFTLVGVIIDRYPWKLHHLGFILAHVGIILLLLGSYVTRQIGVDGSMSFGIGEKQRRVLLSGKEVNIYASFGEGRLKRISRNKANFLQNPPSRQNPYVIESGNYKFEVLEYAHFADRETQIKKSELVKDGPALRFQIEGSRAQFTQWIRATQSKPFEQMQLGPAEIVLSPFQGVGQGFEYKGGNVIVIRPDFKEKDRVLYEIYGKSKNGLIKKGHAQIGDVIPTGWMDFNFRILNFYPHSFFEVSYIPRKYPGKFSQPAILFRHQGQEYWLGLNASRTFFEKDRGLALAFEQSSIMLNFDILLKDFRIGRYQGTMRAASYESDVVVDGKVVNISMNEPMKHDGFTFYQASFQQDEMGKPTTSILSVNKDPGRWLKYLGSLLIVLGSTILFFFKKVFVKQRKSHEKSA
ncbi:MAG: cytochrome c biogenesis protein ResB [Bdellovibrionales bacterium]|nr:cytochrome c biogenesis protein ResB [Bdellovibrionales bacterium]